jgi:antitoxin CptB
MSGGEPEAHALARLRMRSWRRGMREMDLILGPFADAALAGLGPAERDAYERLLEENDQDLYAWIAGSGAPPADFAGLVRRIRFFHGLPDAAAP